MVLQIKKSHIIKHDSGLTMKFPEREGIIEKLLQLNDVDDDLRNRLWSLIVENLRKLNAHEKGTILRGIWIEEIKKPLDEFPEEPNIPEGERWKRHTGTYFRGNFENEEVAEYEDKLLPNYIVDLKDKQELIKVDFLNGDWFRVYSILEFFLKQKEIKKNKQAIILKLNQILVEEKSGYRFVTEEFGKLTSEEEIKEAKKALNHTMDSVRTHLKDALSFLSDRQNPNYRNSMKESISAVEALCKRIVGDSKTTLDKALAKIEEKTKIPFHPALKVAYSKLYGYTSDAEGIRHEIKDKTTVDENDARYFYIICSAFVNYLTELVRKNNIEI